MKKECIYILNDKFNIIDETEIKSIFDLNNYYNKSSRNLKKYLEDVSVFSIDNLKVFYDYIKDKKPLSLIYDWEYYSIRYNVSKEVALLMLKDMKTNKATSLESFIKRHGEEKGRELFSKFQISSKKSTDIDYFKNKYGNDWEDKRNQYFKERSKTCKEYWLKKGYSLEESIKNVSDFQRINSGVSLQYYLNIGYSEQDARDILDLIDKRKGQTKRNLSLIKIKHPNDWKEIYEKYQEDYRRNMVEKGIWLDEDLLEGFKKYRHKVERLTNKTVLFYKDFIHDLNKRGKEYHLDHRYSIKQGFIEDIDPEIIASFINLEIISAETNCSKRADCSISKEYLLLNYKQLYENN